MYVIFIDWVPGITRTPYYIYDKHQYEKTLDSPTTNLYKNVIDKNRASVVHGQDCLSFTCDIELHFSLLFTFQFLPLNYYPLPTSLPFFTSSSYSHQYNPSSPLPFPPPLPILHTRSHPPHPRSFRPSKPPLDLISNSRSTTNSTTTKLSSHINQTIGRDLADSQYWLLKNFCHA